MQQPVELGRPYYSSVSPISIAKPTQLRTEMAWEHGQEDLEHSCSYGTEMEAEAPMARHWGHCWVLFLAHIAIERRHSAEAPWDAHRPKALAHGAEGPSYAAEDASAASWSPGAAHSGCGDCLACHTLGRMGVADNWGRWAEESHRTGNIRHNGTRAAVQSTASDAGRLGWSSRHDSALWKPWTTRKYSTNRALFTGLALLLSWVPRHGINGVENTVRNEADQPLTNQEALRTSLVSSNQLDVLNCVSTNDNGERRIARS